MNKEYFTDLTDLSIRTDVSKRDLNKMVRRLVRIYDPLRIYFFGSFAWGNPHLNSDLDFIAIVETEEETTDDQWGKSGRAFDWFEEKYVDFGLYTKKKFETMISSPATMEHKIYTKGIVMYSQPDLVFDETQPMKRVEKSWFDQAQGHMEVARENYQKDRENLKRLGLFHLQQAIEMALRAFRAFHLLEIKKSHKLEYFMGHCRRLDPDFQTNEFRRRALYRISNYYWFRYDLEKPLPEVKTVMANFELAETILKLVEAKITTMPPPTEPPANWNEVVVKKKKKCRKKKKPESNDSTPGESEREG